MQISLMDTQQSPGRSDYNYIHSSNVLAASETYALAKPGDRIKVSICVAPVSGSARAEYTVSPLEAVESDTATWHAWPLGDVTTTTVDALESPVTAIRCVTTGETVWEVVA